jgi:hypothetical protein
MQDGMTRIRMGIETGSGSSFMQYFGPISYDVEKQIWWDMEPPEEECYPALIQICLNLAKLGPKLPICGEIPAVFDRKKLNLHLKVQDINAFEIAWDRAYSTDRAQNEIE